MAVLSSADPKEYCLGSVPFDFKNRNAALEAQKTFADGSVWEISTPAFDHRFRPEYVGCPIKAVLVLKSPTTIRRLYDQDNSETRKAAWPQSSIHVALDFMETANILKLGRLAPAAGDSKMPALTLDVCGKFHELTEQKETTAKSQQKLSVAELVLLDDSESRFHIAVWGDAYNLLTDIQQGEGISLVGCNATRDPKGESFKVNV